MSDQKIHQDLTADANGDIQVSPTLDTTARHIMVRAGEAFNGDALTVIIVGTDTNTWYWPPNGTTAPTDRGVPMSCPISAYDQHVTVTIRGLNANETVNVLISTD